MDHKTKNRKKGGHFLDPNKEDVSPATATNTVGVTPLPPRLFHNRVGNKTQPHINSRVEDDVVFKDSSNQTPFNQPTKKPIASNPGSGASEKM